MKIVVGARGSQLSIKQVEEVFEALKCLAPQVGFEPIWVKTSGDLDLKASLRTLDKTDFFTREIDQLQLQGKCRISIHSAKDLSEPLPTGLKVVALTKGQDSRDVLVMRPGERLETLKKEGIIGSSSHRRDQMLSRLREDLQYQEVRGPIEKRLEKLFNGEIEGLIVAEAALIRLGLTHLNRIFLIGETAPLQGKLAIVAREDDAEMEHLFAPLDTRKQRVLNVGLSSLNRDEGTHIPLIEIVPRSFDSPEIASAFADIPLYTHLIFTSKSCVEIFFECLKYYGFKSIAGKKILCVGKATAEKFLEKGEQAPLVAAEETQEGVIHLLAQEDLDRAYLFLPQSSRARPALAHTLLLRRVRHQLCPLYDTKTKVPAVKPDLGAFDEIIFTSPSTVDAFIEIFGTLPKHKKLTPIGPITEHKLKFSFY